MTIERRIVVGLQDVKAVTFECEACHSRITMNPDRARDIPEQCAECKKKWAPHGFGMSGTAMSPFLNFVEALAKLRIIGTNTAGFSILLEFEEPKNVG